MRFLAEVECNLGLQIDGEWLNDLSRDFISKGRDILAEAFVKEGRQDQPRIRGQLPTCVDDNGIPNIDLTLNQLEKSMAAGLDEVEGFPINFVQSPDDIYKVLEQNSEIKK